MRPINRPWIFFVCAVFVRGVGRYSYKLRGGYPNPFFVYLDPAVAFDTVDNNVLTDAMRPLGIVKHSLWVITNVRYIYLPGYRVFDEKFRNNLFGYYDQPLALKSFALPH